MTRQELELELRRTRAWAKDLEQQLAEANEEVGRLRGLLTVAIELRGGELEAAVTEAMGE
jgi:hypothetical protein